MALFAGALVSLAQLVGTSNSSSDGNSVSWSALLVFLYSAIMLNLGGAFLSLLAIKMCSDLPLAAQQKLLREGSAASKSPLSRIARGETLGTEILEDHFGLLESFGMSRGYRHVDYLCFSSLMAASVCTFVALTFWVFLSETNVTAGITMITFGPVAIIVVRVFVLAGYGQGWL
jgi:heme A synthase